MKRCSKCGKPLNKRRMDFVLMSQVHLVANKTKYSREEFEAKYDRLERLILEIDPEFYRG